MAESHETEAPRFSIYSQISDEALDGHIDHIAARLETLVVEFERALDERERRGRGGVVLTGAAGAYVADYLQQASA
jgi:hypothetical protein